MHRNADYGILITLAVNASIPYERVGIVEESDVRKEKYVIKRDVDDHNQDYLKNFCGISHPDVSECTIKW